MFEVIIEWLAFVAGLIGTIVILWGVGVALVSTLSLEVARFKGEAIASRRKNLRHQLGSYLLLGLEFLVAADVIRTILTPSFEELGRLGAIVAIRTVLSFFLNLEMNQSSQNG